MWRASRRFTLTPITLTNGLVNGAVRPLGITTRPSSFLRPLDQLHSTAPLRVAYLLPLSATRDGLLRSPTFMLPLIPVLVPLSLTNYAPLLLFLPPLMISWSATGIAFLIRYVMWLLLQPLLVCRPGRTFALFWNPFMMLPWLVLMVLILRSTIPPRPIMLG